MFTNGSVNAAALPRTYPAKSRFIQHFPEADFWPIWLWVAQLPNGHPGSIAETVEQHRICELNP